MRHLRHKEKRRRKKEERRRRRKEERRRAREEEERRKDEIERKLMERIKKQKEKKLEDEREKEMESELEKERQEIQKINDNNQYRHRHFEWKDGFLHSYVPKDNITRSRCFLYCWKLDCKAKVRIDMNLKTCEEFGEHIPHKSIDATKFAEEFPGLLDKDWEHIQYDIKGNERIVMWKI